MYNNFILSGRSPQAAPGSFAETADLDQAQCAGLATNEPEFGQVWRNQSAGHICAKCHVWEEATGDNSYDGLSQRVVLSDALTMCPDCKECAIHPACADKGLCPHCALMEKDALNDRMMEQTLTERNLIHATEDAQSALNGIPSIDDYAEAVRIYGESLRLEKVLHRIQAASRARQDALEVVNLEQAVA